MVANFFHRTGPVAVQYPMRLAGAIFVLALLCWPALLGAVPPGVAVVPFDAPAGDAPEATGGDNSPYGDGETLAALILVRLQKAGGLQLVERGQLDKILKELALAQSGVVTETDAPRLGQLAGAQYVVLGRVARGVGATGYIASLRVVRAESGVVIGAGSATGRDLEQIAARLAADALQTLRIYLALENPDSPYSVLIKLKGGQSGQPDGKNPRYRIGDRLSLEFKVLRHNAAAPARVFLQLYSIDAAGRLTLIYPNRFSPASEVETDRLYRLPAEHDDFEWHLTEPAGSESIQAIVTTRPVDFFQMGERHTVETFPAVDARRFRDDLTTFRGIVTRIKKEKLKDWSAERVTYELVKP